MEYLLGFDHIECCIEACRLGVASTLVGMLVDVADFEHKKDQQKDTKSVAVELAEEARHSSRYLSFQAPVNLAPPDL